MKVSSLVKLLVFFAISSANAEFLSEDPALGDVSNPPSLHRYLYSYQNPTAYVDPTGRTAEQFQTLMTASVERYRNSGNRTALGTAGELTLEKTLRANGEVIIKGPSANPGQHNADLVSYDPETKQLSFFDNKIQTTKGAVSSANNLSSSRGREKSINEAIQKLEKLELDPKMKREISRALTNVQRDSSRAVWAVANATPGELTEVDNKVKRVSQRLVDKGVRLADVTGGKVNVLSADQSASNGKKALKRLGKAVPALGTAVSVADASARISSASDEDAAFRQSMSDLGFGRTAFDSHSVDREIAVIAGEEAGGEGGALGAGGIAAAGPAAGCGHFYPVCVGAAAVVGGFSGDYLGGKAAGNTFDEIAQRQAIEEARRIRHQSSGAKIITEDNSGITPDMR